MGALVHDVNAVHGMLEALGVAAGQARVLDGFGRPRRHPGGRHGGAAGRAALDDGLGAAAARGHVQRADRAARLPRRAAAGVPGAVPAAVADLVHVASAATRGATSSARSAPGARATRASSRTSTPASSTAPPAGRRRSRPARTSPSWRPCTTRPRWRREPAAIVTGSDSGIGRATALALADAGHDVGITWRTDEAGAAATARLVRARGRQAAVARLDARGAGRGGGGRSTRWRTRSAGSACWSTTPAPTTARPSSTTRSRAGGARSRSTSPARSSAPRPRRGACSRQGEGGRIVFVTSVHEHVPLPPCRRLLAPPRRAPAWRRR